MITRIFAAGAAATRVAKEASASLHLSISLFPRPKGRKWMRFKKVNKRASKTNIAAGTQTSPGGGVMQI